MTINYFCFITDRKKAWQCIPDLKSFKVINIKHKYLNIDATAIHVDRCAYVCKGSISAEFLISEECAKHRLPTFLTKRVGAGSADRSVGGHRDVTGGDRRALCEEATDWCLELGVVERVIDVKLQPLKFVAESISIFFLSLKYHLQKTNLIFL